MKTIDIKIDNQKLNDLAEDIFLKISGLGRENAKYAHMREDAFRVRAMVQDKLSVVAEYRFYDEPELAGNCLKVGDTDLICGAFLQLEQEMIDGVYLYVVSAGEVSLPDSGIMDQLYADFWGNAYTDALRQIMIEEIKNTADISDSFGPGFYGMDTAEMTKLESLLEFAQKGLKVKGGMMIPQKSCAGIVFSVNDKYRKLDAACESCQGNHLNCSMCIVNRSR